MTDPTPPPPPDPGESPQAALRRRREEEARRLAALAVDTPLYPALGARCPRCGQRITKDSPETCVRCKVGVRTTEAGRLLVPHVEWWREVLRGASYLPRGLFRVLRSPSLWKFAIVPLLLNLLVLLLAFWIAGYVRNWLALQTGAGSLGSWEAAGWGWWLLAKIVFLLGWVAQWLSFIAIPMIMTWLITAFPFNLIYKILFMPFMELLTEATERIVLRIEEHQAFDLGRFYANSIVSVVDAVLLTLLQGLLYLLLLPINLVPFLGQLLWVLLPPAIFAGMDYTDINLVRRSYTTSEKVTLWRTHDWRFLGYGFTFFFLLSVPIVNAFVIPAAAAGGALLYLELDRK